MSVHRKNRGRHRKRRGAKKSRSKTAQPIQPEVVDALLAKLKGNEDIALSDDEKRILAGVLETWAHLTERAQRNDLSIRQLRDLLGIILQRKKGSGSDGSKGDGQADGEPQGVSTEQTPDQDDAASQNESPTDTSDQQPTHDRHRDKHGRRSAQDFPDAAICHHTHTDLSVGCLCPECGRGKLYQYTPRQYTTISGQPLFMATHHRVEQLQCNVCDEVFKADLSEEARLDGADGRTLYSYSAVALIALFKFFGVVPLHRLQTVHQWMGLYVPDASMFDQCERLANVMAPVVKHMQQQAANAQLLFGDDTSACVINERSAVLPERKTGKLVERTGCHTTCVIAVTSEGHRIAYFRIGIQHTGEVLDALLSQRDQAREAPLVMSDALSANDVTLCKVRHCYCNAHAVRKFKKLEDNYPEAGYATERYKQIFDHEEYCKVNQLSPIQRLDYHREHSKPLFKEICTYGFNLFESQAIEPNSDIGQAYNYLLNNEYWLSAFYRYPGAPLDNNLVESTLRLPVHLRDAAPFYRNAIGAAIAASILTVGVTAYNAGVNLFDYFVAMLRHRDDVTSRPDCWLPWCYESRVSFLETTHPIPTHAEVCAPKEEDIRPVPIVYSLVDNDTRLATQRS